MEKKMVLLSVLLLLQSLQVVLCRNTYCPDGCMCVSQKYAIPSSYCDGFGFQTVPQSLNPDTEILSLTSNKLHKITASDFEKFKHLTRLNIKLNGIQEITRDAFQHMTKLKFLNLGHNSLRSLSLDVFKNLPALEELHLNDNLLESLPKNLFKVLPNLKIIYLQNNQLQDESFIANFKNLEYIDVSNNRLKTIRARMFQNSQNLRTVKLCENEIEEIESSSFHSLPRLKEVLLNDNSINTLDKSVFSNTSNLEKVSLHGNPLRCDCNLYWIFNTMTSASHLFLDKEKMKCHSPSRFLGKPFMELYKENFNCQLSIWGSWTKWSACDKLCDGGQRSRYRPCISINSGEEHNCKGPEKESKICNTTPCEISGLLSYWSTWSRCPPKSQGGNPERVRTRKCINPYTQSEGGLVCDGNLMDKEFCYGEPVNGGWSQWSTWSDCSKECHVGTATRTRTCTNPIPQYSGALCDGLTIQQETKVCLAALCPPKAHWSEWSDYTKCSTSCGKGTQTRRRQCMDEFNKSYKLRNICPGKDTQTKYCHNKKCAVNGSWSSWLQWSSCEPMSCKRSRIRNCVKADRYNTEKSHCKGDSIEQEFCPQSVCSIYSVWSQWGDWSQCSKVCGEGGIRTRTRECPGEKNHPSVTCGENRLESKACNTHACTDHEWGEWGEWSNCPNLMTNKQVRKRECVGEGPKRCPGRSKERRECRPIDSVGDGKTVEDDKQCKPRRSIKNGAVTNTPTRNGMIARYRCNQHYRLKGGSDKVSCVKGEGWTSNFTPYCIPNCGKSVHKSYSFWYSRARLHGGQVTIPHSWPWQVLLEVKTRDVGWKLSCGGSLINDRWVVTAGHCLFDKPPKSRLFRPEEIRIYLGVHNLTKRNRNKNVQMSYAKYVMANPNFHRTLLDNDIGLIELETPAKLNDEVLPVCLPSRKQKNLTSVGNVGTVIGWGVTRNGRASEVLKELRLPVIRYEDCVHAYRKNYNMTTSMFCAGKNTAEDTCKGDSGGGFLFRDPRRKKWTLQGIVSWGGPQCGKPDQPSVYTKVSRFTSWIRTVMRERRYAESLR